MRLNHADQERAAQTYLDNMSPPEADEGIFGDLNEACEVIEDRIGDLVKEHAIEAIAEFLCGWDDESGRAGLLRNMLRIADRCKREIEEVEQERSAPPDYEDAA